MGRGRRAWRSGRRDAGGEAMRGEEGEAGRRRAEGTCTHTGQAVRVGARNDRRAPFPAFIDYTSSWLFHNWFYRFSDRQKLQVDYFSDVMTSCYEKNIIKRQICLRIWILQRLDLHISSL